MGSFFFQEITTGTWYIFGYIYIYILEIDYNLASKLGILKSVTLGTKRNDQDLISVNDNI